MPNLVTYLKLFAAVTAWGGTFIAAKYAVIENSVEMAALLRFIASSILLLIILYLKHRTLPVLNLFQLIYIALLGLSGVAVYNFFFFFGLQTVEAGRGALIITSNPLWVALGSAIFFGQRFRLINIIGLLFCVFGVSIVLSKGNLPELFSSGIGIGELALLGCALSWSTYTLLGKYIMHSPHPISALVLVTYSCVCGTIILAVWILLSE
ncbi:MAG: DMT family transporter, partial [Gammaproteobacteria bacterium]|nr:DMT family transporter [Gammaproteobacteria bacterium]